jgi:hypothetical protein
VCVLELAGVGGSDVSLAISVTAFVELVDAGLERAAGLVVESLPALHAGMEGGDGRGDEERVGNYQQCIYSYLCNREGELELEVVHVRRRGRRGASRFSIGMGGAGGALEWTTPSWGSVTYKEGQAAVGGGRA